LRDANEILLDEGHDGLRDRFDAAQPEEAWNGRASDKQSTSDNGTGGRPGQNNEVALEFDEEIKLSKKIDAVVKNVLHPGDTASL
jgi:hypothetical protein